MDSELVRPELWIGGKWMKPVHGKTYPVENPATGEKLAAVAFATTHDVENAYQAALLAFQDWRSAPAAERATLLHRISHVVLEHLDELAILEARNSGNPLQTCIEDIRKGVAALQSAAGYVMELKGETYPATTPRNLHLSVREPYGVVGQIVPFNHPLLFLLSRVGAALAAGNATIIKPAEQTPVTALRLAELLTGVVPPGLINILTGGAETGAAIVSHPKIRRIAFTGGVETGLAVLRTAAESGTIKRITLELGGKNPIILFPDCNLDRAIPAVVQGMNFTRCQGQSCGSTSRLFLHEDIYNDALERILELASNIRPGLPELPETEMGPLVSRKQFNRVLEYIESAKRQGARLLLGGSKANEPELSRGYFVMPTIFDEVRPDMTIAQEEIFGPVLSVIRWRDYDEMITHVNNVRFGLTASIWTENINTALRTAAAVEAGFIWVNGVEKRYAGVPFGGYKDSGFGQEHGLKEIISYTQEKVMNIITY